jgi:hypothetical protein
MANEPIDAETTRLREDDRREKNWKRWGPYLAERQWGTVREDYSINGDCWNSFSHDHSRSRAYRWGEDGLMGITDRECRMCFAIALWNEHDPILKERLFGLTNPQANHGEDVKECYYYLDSTPTHSYMKGLYKYPQTPFPYDNLVTENTRRKASDPEFELLDTGAFNDGKYFDVVVEYAKNTPNDILIRITAFNRGPMPAMLHLLPTLWFRNCWSWGCAHEGCEPKPQLTKTGPTTMQADHPSLKRWKFDAQPLGAGIGPQLIFTENESNLSKLFGADNHSPYVKDAFHSYVIQKQANSVNPANIGTKAAAYYAMQIEPGEHTTIQLRLSDLQEAPQKPFGEDFDKIFAQRLQEADAFYARHIPANLPADTKSIARQAYAGLFWSKQFYFYIVKEWLRGDPDQPVPSPERLTGRNHDWKHVYARDVLSMPDKWEYPWFAAWDLGFHMVSLARVDPDLAKSQLLLLLREWYMHPNGQLPAYEFAFGDVNPPVHAWACWRVYKMTGPRGHRDKVFLERAFQKLLLNFTWWVNRKDPNDRNVFSGGFLGLDNIGVFDRSQPLPTGGTLEQADGTAWMAFYCSTMLAMALELASTNAAYEDIASKFFEHFIAIIDATNSLGGNGLWDETDGFYYDQLLLHDHAEPLKVRSLVGLLPLIAVENLDQRLIDRLPGFKKRMQWFLDNRKDLAYCVAYLAARNEASGGAQRAVYQLSVPSKERLVRSLTYMLDENEFLSPYGLRSVSKFHKNHPYIYQANGTEWRVDYTPGESTTTLFGGNSNWRGPVWFPINFLLIEALERYHLFYGDDLKMEFPTFSGNLLNLKQIARELASRLVNLFVPDENGRRPCHGQEPRYATDPYWKDLCLYYEYFHGDTGRGCGASHQTGWTALVARILSGFTAGGASGADDTKLSELTTNVGYPGKEVEKK